MIYVWVLVFYVSHGSNAGGPSVIDNIATRDECMRIRPMFDDDRTGKLARCIQVGKVKP